MISRLETPNTRVSVSNRPLSRRWRRFRPDWPNGAAPYQTRAVCSDGTWRSVALMASALSNLKTWVGKLRCTTLRVVIFKSTRNTPTLCFFIVPITLRVISAVQKPLLFIATSQGV